MIKNLSQKLTYSCPQLYSQRKRASPTSFVVVVKMAPVYHVMSDICHRTKAVQWNLSGGVKASSVGSLI